MSSSLQTNLHSIAAAQIQSHAVKTEGEKILEEAFKNVKQRIPDTGLPLDVVDQIAQGFRPEELLQVFDDLRSNSRILRSSSKDSRRAKLGPYVDIVLNFKDLGSNLAQIHSTVASPIWGVICAMLAILQNVLKTGETLNQVRDNLSKWYKRHATLYPAGHPLSPHLYSELLAFNEVVIEFTLKVAAVFQRSTIWTTLATASKNLLSELDAFSKRLSEAAKDVDSSVSYDTYHLVNDLKTSQAFAPVPQPHQLAFTCPPTTRVQKYGVPILSRCFIGREHELQAIFNSFKSNATNDCPRAAIYGITGVGKSQTALRYAETYRADRDRTDGIYWSIFFVTANDKNLLQPQFSLIAEELGLLEDSKLAQDYKTRVVSLVRRHLKTLNSWLFIFDDVVNFDDVKDYVPYDGQGHVLFTTKNDYCARQLAVDPKDAIEIQKLDVDTTGVKLVLDLAPKMATISTVDIDAARKIAAFADGLPLAIEQIIVLGEHAGIGWRKALPLVMKKFEALKRQSSTSNLIHELPTAAVVATVLTHLKQTNRKAVELFQILIYLDTSAIPLEILHNAKENVSKHFQRSTTYDRGQRPAPPGRSRAELELTPAEKKFDLLDYDPFSRSDLVKMFNRILHRGEFSSIVTNTSLPRADSGHDVEMEKLWNDGAKLIQAVFEAPVNIDSAIDALVQVGLVRKLDRHSKKVWIHELFALVGRNLLEMDPTVQHTGTAHLAATMVYLTFPLPSSFDPWWALDECLKSLPHAIASRQHLKNFGILNDCTIGPELTHLIASTLDLARHEYAIQREQDDGNERIIEYYKDAFFGYRKAWERLQIMPGVTWQRIVLSTFTDYAWTNLAGYMPRRYIEDYERFSGSPPWRCINTSAKIGSILSFEGKRQEAIKWLKAAIKLAEDMFGGSHVDVIAINTTLMWAYFEEQQWEDAYKIACRKAHAFMNPEASDIEDGGGVYKMGLCDTTLGGEMANHIGICAIRIPGMEHRAFQMFEVELAAQKHIWGERSGYCVGPLQRLSHAYEKVGNVDHSMYWQLRALEVAMEDSLKEEMPLNTGDTKQSEMPGRQGTPGTAKLKKEVRYGTGEYRALHDETVIEVIARFRELRMSADVSDPALKHCLKLHENSARLWELRREHDAIPNIEAEAAAEEGDDEDNEVEEVA